MNQSLLFTVILAASLSLNGCATSTEQSVATQDEGSSNSEVKKQTLTPSKEAVVTPVTQTKKVVAAPEKPVKESVEKVAEPLLSGSYADYPQAQAFIDEMKAEGFSEAYLKGVLGEAKRQQSILTAISRPAEKSLNWGEYRKIFIQPKRIKQGVQFWQENQAALALAEKTYGVPAEVIVSIIGVETRYGRIMGSYRVLDAVATLGFDYPRRSEFFLGQLKEYLRLVREEKTDVTAHKGSYAGAMGYGQFIPSSYRSFAIDFDNDGHRDIWNNKTDAIGSVANYFAEHGWAKGEPVISGVSFSQTADEAWFSKGRKGLIPELTIADWQQRGVEPELTLSPEGKAILMRLEIGEDAQYWLGLHNFYVITRYNHSKLYAMAVYRLSEQIKMAYEKSLSEKTVTQTKK
ncbi:lytic murein transglycosylase B [Neptuniibacter sp. 1_MG-2023]|uniref:lytic murein transglycosylase B n=1 Tax=Neptuniibacter sp. 1_MG-2023 TaxID=3062662 RepID=UPI0026E2C403|nr:lytic murein transglycosylase B [Neptuniibacter sp. 1_MG-2023]MDO6593329.1 lytic murein transglycosylase B [Neptuniibacter sp. 1_MG-2023]